MTTVSRSLHSSAAAATPRTRLLFVDNLRWTMILLVLSMHAADTLAHEPALEEQLPEWHTLAMLVEQGFV